MVLATGARHPTTDCACRELTCALSFAIGVRSQGSFDAEVSGVSPSPASPRRGCLSVKHPARPASSSTSATKDWSFSAPYIRTKRRSCPSPRLSPQTVFPGDQTARALFSAAQPKSVHRDHRMHRARPPAPRFLLRRPPVTVPPLAIPTRGFFAQSPRRQLKSAKA